MRVGVLTAGGDCPGLNAVIRAVVRKAIREYDYDVLGFLDGWKGTVDADYISLDIDKLRGTLPRGGTLIGTSRINPFAQQGGPDTVLRNMKELGVEGVIAIGGEGTLSCAREMYDHGLAVIGVPKTIDNDVGITERTFGFDTAVSIATDAIGRLHTTAESHNRVMVCEVMGRHVGHIAVAAGIAGGASLTLIPEEPFDIEEVCASIVRRHEQYGKFASIVVVAEGAKPVEGTLDIGEDTYDEYGHVRLGGVANVLGREIEGRTGYETRVTILGHVQRGGTPTAYDRVLATRYGIAAIDAIADRDWGKMVALQADQIVRVPLAEATKELKMVSPEIWGVAKQFFS